LFLVLGHLVPEAIYEKISVEYSETDVYWHFGAAAMAGVLAVALLDMWAHMLQKRGVDEGQYGDVQAPGPEAVELKLAGGAETNIEGGSPKMVIVDPNTKGEKTDVAASKPIVQKGFFAGFFDYSRVKPMCWSMIMADFLHNTVDGMIIANAFKSCSESYGWTVVCAVIYHELPTEVSEYCVIVTNGMTCAQGLFWNFLASLSALVGCLIYMGSDVSDYDEGMMLANSSGILITAALGDLLPDLVHAASKSKSHVLVELGLFVLFVSLGAIVVGLPLIEHGHCTATGAAAHAH